jgi:acyl-CoA dehydrogenase
VADSTFLNWPFFDDDHRRLAEGLRHWAAEHIAPLPEPAADDAVLDAHCRGLVGMLGRAGWLRYCVPCDYGGAGKLQVRNLCLARETLSYVSGLADFTFAIQGLGTGPITLFGSQALKKRYLENVAAGKSIAAFALSEPGAGSDVGAIATTAKPDRSDYVLDGVKTWISNAGLADHYVVFARTGQAPGTRGLSAFVVDADNPGLKVTERIAVTAPHPLGTITLDKCRVPASHMLAGPGDGFKVAMGTLDIFRSTVGAAALGFARRALDEAVARSRERQAFGRHLREFQLIQAKIADMAVAVDAAALLVYRAAWAKDTVEGGRVTREASMAKLFATEAAQKVVDQAVQIFGGLGLVHGNIAESLYREIRALRIYEGTSEIQKLVIAAEILGEKQGLDV